MSTRTCASHSIQVWPPPAGHCKGSFQWGLNGGDSTPTSSPLFRFMGATPNQWRTRGRPPVPVGAQRCNWIGPMASNGICGRLLGATFGPRRTEPAHKACQSQPGACLRAHVTPGLCKSQCTTNGLWRVFAVQAPGFRNRAEHH